jgi:hypothetical protein
MMTFPWLKDVDRVMGLHEVRDNKALSAYLRSDGAALGNPSKMPWCGDLVSTALHNALPNEPRPGALGVNPYWALNWNLFGVEAGEHYGAVVTFKRPGGGHVGFLIGISPDGLWYRVRGGNQSNRVSDTWIAKSRCQAKRWPKTYANPMVRLPVLKKTGSVSTNEA